MQLAIFLVPFENSSNSAMPIGPFHIINFESNIYFLNNFIVLGPISTPIKFSGILSISLVLILLRLLILLVITQSTGKIIFVLVCLALYKKSSTIANSSSKHNDDPICPPDFLTKGNDMPPPIRMLSAILRNVSKTCILEPILEPPITTVKGFFLLFFNAFSSLISFSNKKPWYLCLKNSRIPNIEAWFLCETPNASFTYISPNLDNLSANNLSLFISSG